MSIIHTTISHSQYESIKLTFKKHRDHAGMRYLFGSSKESDTTLHHEWRGSEDHILIDFHYKEKNDKGEPIVLDAEITYKFTDKSTILSEVYALLLSLDTSIKIEPDVSKSQLSHEKELAIRNFKYNIGIDDSGKQFLPMKYSDNFVKKVIQYIIEDKIKNPKRCLID